MIRLFRRNEIDPFPVHDRVVFRNMDRTHTFTVRADDGILVVGLNKAQKRLATIDENTSEEDLWNAALFLAETIFGEKQAMELMDFYDGEPLAVITVCGTYFQERLGKIITRTQKKKKSK